VGDGTGWDEENAVTRTALREQGARPFASADFTTTGLVWDQFSDGNSGTDFVTQNYNPANDPTNGDGLTALQNTHATWTGVGASNFSFDYGGTTNRCPSLVKECQGPQKFDGKNDVGWLGLTGCCTLGVTWYSTSVDEADMALNTKFSIECSEECDGTDLGSETCAGLGFEGGGTLGCDLDCTFNTDLRITCGDGVCEGSEDSCSCPSDCGGSLCGNDTIDCSETCDGGNLGSKSCTTLGLGFDGGDLTCNTNCDGFITSACTSPGCALLQLGETCASDGACCSNKCRGKPGNKTCK